MHARHATDASLICGWRVIRSKRLPMRWELRSKLSIKFVKKWRVCQNLTNQTKPPPSTRPTSRRQTMINTAKAIKEEDPKRWTQSRIAAALGVDRASVSRWLDISNVQTHKANTDARVSVPKQKRTEILERLDAGEAQSQVAAALGVKRTTVEGWLSISIGGPAKANTDAGGVTGMGLQVAGH